MIDRIRKQQRLLRIACAQRKAERAREDILTIINTMLEGDEVTPWEGRRFKEAQRHIAEARSTLETLNAG